MIEILNLIGKAVEIFMIGNWLFDGTVKYSDDDLIVLTDANGDDIIINRSQISAAKIINNLNPEKVLSEPVDDGEEQDFPEPEVSVDELNSVYNYGSILPSDLLIQTDEIDYDVDFSISFAPIEIVGGKSHDSAEKV